MRVLLAYDGSIAGRDALFGAPEIASLQVADRHLLAVLPIPDGVFLSEGYVPDVLFEDDKLAAQRCLDEGVQLLRASGSPVRGYIAWGEPVEEICRLALELPADLILVAHPKATAFAARWWRGWVGSSLLEQTPCSVLVSIY
ncbi:MAG: universal stress protein [Burkholderiales bacterium]|nr:universal stress protein [Burkholderiales bacterium]